jgi:hypothetical protein
MTAERKRDRASSRRLLQRREFSQELTEDISVNAPADGFQ